MESVTLPDGRRVTLGERTSGGSKNHTRFGTLPDGRPVVVKQQANHGRLNHEAIALTYAAGCGLRVPRVIDAWRPPEGGYCLVLTREAGVRTHHAAGWRRMGFDLARLAAAPIDDCPLPHVGAEQFATDHLERLAAVRSLINDHADRVAAAVRHIATGRATLTHGDPGSGNYLDHEGGGTILDWETASLAPFGIDIGRAAFIALLDNGNTGIPEELRTAVVAGYRAGLPAPLDEVTITAGTIVAGLQFIHGRHTQPLRSDRTAKQAVDALIGFIHRQ